MSLPVSLRVPYALNHLSDAKKFMAEPKLRREGRAPGVWPTGGRVERRTTALLCFKSPAAKPSAGLKGSQRAGVPSSCEEPVRKDPGRHEGGGGLTDAKEQGQRARLGAMAKPCTAPVQNGVLEGSMPIEEKRREARDQERRKRLARVRRVFLFGQPERSHSSRREGAGEWGALPRDRNGDASQVNRGNGECDLQSGIAPPEVLKGSGGKLLKHPWGEDIIPTTQPRRNRVREEGGVVGEMRAPRLADIEAVGEMNRRGNEIDLRFGTMLNPGGALDANWGKALMVEE